MNVAQFALLVSCLVCLGGAAAFAYFGIPVLAIGLTIQTAIFCWLTAKHWGDL